MHKPSWQLEDAQLIADQFPYTFYKPSHEVIDQLRVGNQVKIIFRFESDAPDQPNAERMWVQITNITDQTFTGILDNDPFHIKDIKYQDLVEFQACHIIDTDLHDPIPSITEKYIKRCFVTNNILYHGQSIGYIYREEPEHEDDSGWRITAGNETDEYMDDSNNAYYVSLGAVLNQDNSIISLLEREVGVAFVKDESGIFIELND